MHNDHFLKIGVIIQGPLITFGQGPNNIREGFKTIDSIKQNLTNIQGFDAIKDYVVITWTPSNESEMELVKELADNDIHFKTIEVPKEPDPDHRYKHHYSIQNGITYLDMNEKPDFFIKIRTDMAMPYSFWEFAINYANNYDNRLCISELYFYPFYMGDFIYLGKRDTFIGFIDKILKLKARIIHPIIACDIGMRYAGVTLRDQKTLQKLRIYGANVFRWGQVKNDWITFVNKNLTTIPKVVWKQIVWRKRKIGDFLNAEDFFFEHYSTTKPLGLRRRLYDLMVFYDKYDRLANQNKFERKVLYAIQFLKSKSAIPGRIYKKLKRVLIKKKMILSRVACLGQDVFKLKFEGQLDTVSLVNMQKVRVDLFLEWVNGAARPVPEIIEPFLERKDIFDMIVQQKEIDWLKVDKSEDIILIDSFSELTDQRFTHRKEGWSFCCNYTDINHETSFAEVFEANGLLSETQISKHYDLFFSWIKENYPKKQVVYIHFPASLDTRVKFVERAASILNTMRDIEKRFNNVVNIYVSDDLVFHYEDDDFPYHYSKNTQMAFLKEWQKKTTNNANN